MNTPWHLLHHTISVPGTNIAADSAGFQSITDALPASTFMARVEPMSAGEALTYGRVSESGLVKILIAPYDTTGASRAMQFIDKNSRITWNEWLGDANQGVFEVIDGPIDCAGVDVMVKVIGERAN